MTQQSLGGTAERDGRALGDRREKGSRGRVLSSERPCARPRGWGKEGEVLIPNTGNRITEIEARRSRGSGGPNNLQRKFPVSLTRSTARPLQNPLQAPARGGCEISRGLSAPAVSPPFRLSPAHPHAGCGPSRPLPVREPVKAGPRVSLSLSPVPSSVAGSQ